MVSISMEKHGQHFSRIQTAIHVKVFRNASRNIFGFLYFCMHKIRCDICSKFFSNKSKIDLSIYITKITSHKHIVLVGFCVCV